MNQHCHLVLCLRYSKRLGVKINIETLIRYVFIIGLSQLFSQTSTKCTVTEIKMHVLFY